MNNHPSQFSAVAPPNKWSRRAGLAALALLPLCVADALWVEPNWIQVTHHTVKAPLSSPLKIAHLADLHTSGLGRREKSLLAYLEREKPDLIVITGDTVASEGAIESTRTLLMNLHAPLGVWLVRGNWENWRPIPNERQHYESAGVKLLLNEGRAIRADVWLAGVDDPASGSPDLVAALAGAPRGAFTIALFHAPGYFDRTAGRYALALAGHTHGGQVCLPLIGPLWLPRGSGRFLEGWYERNGSHMYVSRGIGTSLLPVRFWCRPELAIITLEP